jgi:EAL domain-containing protein (putative c-di-GMP-specific phosphodiesterase class I)
MLAYLDRFPIDFLKIDRSFVARLGTGTRPDTLVQAIISLAHAHDLVVTAEGVETPEQAEILRRMGCERGQGWLFGRPAPPAAHQEPPPPPPPPPPENPLPPNPLDPDEDGVAAAIEPDVVVANEPIEEPNA